ncbi:DUF6585 family protein [Tengunoibacter tsumagoiensis]|uniref:Uncharacterized protein n=1 Tax=Tengunoibacter tsumagoiensis TaxID=2014871 RepID=A0A401ZUM0_9CHLR|nr:DUF6585 family protein [Tengunoibacter tsumagoiensis]GCE10648.1 hypothetical protein KTT_05070 [Tengunoibacter tsumagoiensis]
MRVTSERQLPQRVRRYAQTYRLGTPRIVYEPSHTGQVHLLFGPLALLIGGFIIGAYYFFYDAIFSWWPDDQTFLVLFIGGAWLVIGLWILLPPLVAPHLKVFLCPKGLIYLQRRLEVIRWDQIKELSKELIIDKKARSSLIYQIVRQDGKVFVLTSELPYLDRLGGFLEREVTRQLLPGMLARYTQMDKLTFGEIVLSPAGIAIEHEKQLLPWSELESLEVSDTTLSLRRRGDEWEWATLSVSKLPNLGVLQGVVEQIQHTTALSPNLLAYNAGFSFHFGAFTLDKTGVYMKGLDEVIPWSEIAALGVGENEVFLRRKDQPHQWQTIPLARISDVHTLQELLDYLWSIF